MLDFLFPFHRYFSCLTQPYQTGWFLLSGVYSTVGRHGSPFQLLGFSQLRCKSTLGNFSSSHEYVVVGAGSAGCVVASRLSAQNNRVLLLEAGSEDMHWRIRMPAAVMYNLEDDKFNWKYTTQPQEFLNNRWMGDRIWCYLGNIASQPAQQISQVVSTLCAGSIFPCSGNVLEELLNHDFKQFNNRELKHHEGKQRWQRQWTNLTNCRRQKGHVNMWNWHDLGVVVPHVRLQLLHF